MTAHCQVRYKKIIADSGILALDAVFSTAFRASVCSQQRKAVVLPLLFQYGLIPIFDVILDYLYHYTSVDVLELILSNHTIRFNPLYKMDDRQEQYSAHGAAQGAHYFISSWTSEENELPRMWRNYCKPDPQKGVRLRLPVNPFSKTENNLYQPVPEEAIKAKLNREKIVQAILRYYPEVKRTEFEGVEGLKPLNMIHVFVDQPL